MNVCIILNVSSDGKGTKCVLATTKTVSLTLFIYFSLQTFSAKTFDSFKQDFFWKKSQCCDKLLI